MEHLLKENASDEDIRAFFHEFSLRLGTIGTERLNMINNLFKWIIEEFLAPYIKHTLWAAENNRAFFEKDPAIFKQSLKRPNKYIEEELKETMSNSERIWDEINYCSPITE